MKQQTFTSTDKSQWLDLDQFPGAQLLPLAEPVPKGSIHRLRMRQGTTIPIHQHPCSEYVYVLKGRIQTGQRTCEAGTFWYTPAQVTQGPHYAATDVELLTVRLGEMGEFEENAV